MDYMTTFNICSSGLTAQRKKMEIIASNVANIDTTRTPEGGPYKRKVVILTSDAVVEGFDSELKEAVRAVKVDEIVELKSSIMVHDPSHPDADANGFVAKPDINLVTEMADMITVSRDYEAIISAFDATKNMAIKTLDIGK